MSILALICCEQHEKIIAYLKIGDNTNITDNIASLPCISSPDERAKMLAQNILTHDNIIYDNILKINEDGGEDNISYQHYRGIDNEYNGGQTLRQIQLHLRGFLQKYATRQQHYVLITHQHILKACYALVRGDDLRDAGRNRDIDNALNKIHFFKLWQNGLLTLANPPLALTQ